MRWQQLTLGILTLLLFCSCSRQQWATVARQEVYGGTFKLMITSPVETLDPQKILFLQDWEIAALIFEGLVGYGENWNTVQPLLAESWQEMDDGRRWIFSLRRDVYFQDDPCMPQGKGRRMVAQDVLYTFERLATPATQCWNWYLLAGKIQGIDDFYQHRAVTISGISVLDDSHVEFRLTKSYSTFLKILATTNAYIVPKEAVEFYGENFNQHPVGTGPFRLVRWKPLQELLLLKNDHYWRRSTYQQQLPFLDAVQFQVVSSSALAFSEFLKGENYLLKADEKFYQRLRNETLSPDKYQVVSKVPGLSLRFLGISMDNGSPTLQHADFRQALAKAFDRTPLVSELREFDYIPANSLVPAYFFKDDFFSWHQVDTVAAKAVFAGYGDLLKKNPLAVATNLDGSKDVELFQKTMQRYTVPVRIDYQPLQYYENIVQRHPDLFRVSYLPSFPDPEEYYSLFYSKSDPQINLTGYRNAEYDLTLEQAMVERDEAKRLQLFTHLEQILARDVPALYLNHDSQSYYIVPAFVHGMEIGFIIPDYRQVWLESAHEPAR